MASALGGRGGFDLSFSNSGRRGYERAGLSFGDGGFRAYYDRHRFNGHDLHGFHDFHDIHDFHGHGLSHLGVSFLGGFYGGLYYPYGYLSHYDTYYHRYPYDYITVYDTTPSWTVYVEPPIVETVYVDASGHVGTQAVPADRVGPPLSTGAGVSGEADGVIQVEPQERIPVNNAWVASGEEAFRTGDYEAARKAFSYAVLEEPTNGFAELAYALAHFAQHSYDAAGDALRRGLRLVPDVIDRPIDITRQYGKPEELRTHLDALVSHLGANPGDANGWFVLGYVRFSAGEPEAAARAFAKSASLNPEDSFAAVLRDAAERVTVR